MPHLTDDDIMQLAVQLRSQRDAVLEVIRPRLHQAGDTEYLAGETDLAQLQLELAELKDIDNALARIDAGAFGGCAKCGARISLPRLRAQPAARMCLPCQETLERHRLPPAG